MAEPEPATDPDRRVYIRQHINADLAFVFTEAEVPLVYQVKIGRIGYRTVRRFASWADTRPALRTALQGDLALDVTAGGDAGAEARVVAASIICAWETASELASREAVLKADSRANNTQRPVSVLERVAMRRAYEHVHGVIPDCECPSAEYMAQKFEETEQEVPTASPLDEVASIEDLESQSLSAVLDISGQLRIKKAKSKGLMPTSSEELRAKLRVECNVWAFLGTKFTAKGWLQGVSPMKWQRYADFLLGDKVSNLKIPCLQGDAMQSVRPPWNVVLHYEYELRKAAMKAARDSGQQIDEALSAAMANSELKEVHFTSPLALMNMSRERAPKREGEWAKETNAEKKWRKGKGKGKGKEPKGKGKGKGKEAKGKGKGLISSTADGRQVCYGYNDPAGCQVEGCSRLHICRVKGCGQAHPTHAHPGTAE